MSKQSMPPMSLELGHYRWCHTGYCYTHFPKQCLGCMAPSVIKNKGTLQMSSLEVLKRERKYNLSKLTDLEKRKKQMKNITKTTSQVAMLSHS